MKYYKFFLISLGVITLDQVVKMLVYFYMDKGVAGQIHLFGDVFKLHYLTNEGMAFGLQIGGKYGKLILTLFRLVAMVGISYYLYTLIKKEVHVGLLISIAMILGGAIGNVIDSTFYGVLLTNNAPYDAPMPWFYGQVIDMFYIDIWEGYLPEWIPLIGGSYKSFWPVFNVADASIFCGVATILTFQKRFFKETTETESTESLETNEQAETV